MKVLAGTSGYQYGAWRGSFYPERCRKADMLAHYAGRLPTVELNNTFYRTPKAELLARWGSSVPQGFHFAVKAPQRITHRKRLLDCEDVVAFLCENLQSLGDRLGPLLFQLPPNLKKDMARLDAFLRVLPVGLRAAFEFRHETWFDEQVYRALADRNLALCAADAGVVDPSAAWPATADYGYLRLRRDSYDSAALDGIATRLRTHDWRQTFVYFKHEAAGPELAQQLMRLCSE